MAVNTLDVCASIGPALIGYEKLGLTYGDMLYTYNGGNSGPILSTPLLQAKGRISNSRQRTLSTRAQVFAPIGPALISYEKLGLIYDDMLYTYNGGNSGPILSTLLLQAKGRISNSRQRTLSTRAQVFRRLTYTLSIRAKVSTSKIVQAKSRINPTLYVGSRVSRRQGWPVPGDDDPGIFLWTDTSVNSRSRLSAPVVKLSSSSLALKSRVWYGKNVSTLIGARIVGGQGMSMRANILPPFFRTHLPMSFIVTQEAQTRTIMIFYTEGKASSQALQSRAYIAKRMQTHMTGHFLVVVTPQYDSIMSISDPTISVKPLQALGLRVRITK